MSEYIGDFDNKSSASAGLVAYGTEFREPIVRCKECRWKSRFDSCMRLDEWHEENWFAVEPDGFCAWGEVE